MSYYQNLAFQELFLDFQNIFWLIIIPSILLIIIIILLNHYFSSTTSNSLKKTILLFASSTTPGFSYLLFFNKKHWSFITKKLGESPCAFDVASYAGQYNNDIINNKVKIIVMEKTKLLKIEEDEVPNEPNKWDGPSDESQEDFEERVRLYKEEISKFQKITDILYFLGRNDYIYEYKFL